MKILEKKLYLGREVNQDNFGFYLMFSDKDSPEDMKRNHHSTRKKAIAQLLYMRKAGHHYINAKFDPSI